MPLVDERVARSVALEQAYVHDVYDQFYDNPRSKPWPKVQQFLQDLEPGSIVCDVGCGNGKYLNVNSSVFNIGGDKSVRLSEVAREKENEVIVLDNLALPYRDESLDAVLSIAVVHHLATSERRICALRELARVLRIGGRLIISVWAMEQTHRKFESQDVLVPWHRPKHLSTPSLELTSTTNTSEDDCLPPYHAYTQTSDSDSNKSIKTKNGSRRRGKNRKGRSIDPGRNSSPSSSSLSSPNETCYSFVRRAIQKLAGSRRVGVHKPWFLESWGHCSNKTSSQHHHHQQRHHHYYDPDGCECCDCNIQDLPIELRRIDDDDLPQRRKTFPSSQLINDISNNLKSKSMTNIIKTVETNNIIRSQSTTPNHIPEINIINIVNNLDGMVSESGEESIKIDVKLNKPKLIKQKKSICEDDEDEALDQPTDMNYDMIQKNKSIDFTKLFPNKYRGSVLKQRSLNDELMSNERLKEKEKLKQNIQKQTSLNEDLIYHQQNHQHNSTFDSFFSISTTTSKRLQLFKTGFTNKIKNSTNNIEKVTSNSLKNGFVKMFQNWKSSELISPNESSSNYYNNGVVIGTPSVSGTTTSTLMTSASMMIISDDKSNSSGVLTTNSGGGVVGSTNGVTERRHSKEDGSDSSKDSSLQSDTSVDSEDSFASVIFVPKSDPMSPNVPLSPGPTSPRLVKNSSVPNSPRIKQSSCPTSPRIKQMPLTIYPLTKQLSSPKPSTTSTSLFSSIITSSTTTSSSTTTITDSLNDKSHRDHLSSNITNNKESTTIVASTTTSSASSSVSTIKLKTLAQKYSVPQIPKFRKSSRNSSEPTTSTSSSSLSAVLSSTSSALSSTSPVLSSTSTVLSSSTKSSTITTNEIKTDMSRNERLKKIKELLSQKPGFGLRTSSSSSSTNNHQRSNFPIVRHSSINNGKIEAIAKPLPKLLSLELFNPETDDKDSDSSCVSSPDSIDSVISVQKNTKFKFPPLPPSISSTTTSSSETSWNYHQPVRNDDDNNSSKSMSLLEAAADVANTLDEAVETVIKSSPKSKKRSLKTGEVLSIIERKYSSTDTMPLLLNVDDHDDDADDDDDNKWNDECHKHLTDFADMLSEKLLNEIDNLQMIQKTDDDNSTTIDNLNDPYINRLSEELDDLSKLSAEIQKQNEYLAKLSASDNLFNKQCKKCHRIDDNNCKCFDDRTKIHNKKFDLNNKKVPVSNNNNNNNNNSSSNSDSSYHLNKKSNTNDSLNNFDNNNCGKDGGGKVVVVDNNDIDNYPIHNKLSVSKNSIKTGTSIDSCDSEKGSSTNSMISSVATSVNFGQSTESTDGLSDKFNGDKDTNSISRYSDGGGSTASLASCPEWKTIKIKSDDERLLNKDNSSQSLGSGGSGYGGIGGCLGSTLSSTSSLKRRSDKSTLLSDTSQDSLPSDNIGGEITYHRYYHVFREGELDQLIEKYVENLHIISSYYDHASWCIIAEKVQVWTI